VDIGNAVYLITDHKTAGAGVPAIICGLYERSARIAIEREEATKTLEVPLGDLMSARTRRVLSTMLSFVPQPAEFHVASENRCR
jgi:hypothetical protein